MIPLTPFFPIVHKSKNTELHNQHIWPNNKVRLYNIMSMV